MILHRHFESDAPKTVTILADVTPKAPKAKPEAKTTEPKKPGRPKSK